MSSPLDAKAPTIPPADNGRLRFEMRLLLGAGAFGEVYLATLSSAGGIRQEVAVKLLARDLDPRSQPLERLRDEGRILGALNHPVILQVRDLVVLDGRVGLVTEYVPGLDLADVLARAGRLPPRVALQVAGDVADALDVAWHALASDGSPLRLVHRDVKPANLRITPHGTVKLLDFGIAKIQAPDRETETGHVVLIGSLPYMAPEVLHLDMDEADSSRDVFALGCTLFECLTGEPWYAGLPRKEMRRVTARPERYAEWHAGRLERVPPTSPAGVHDLLAAMLAHDPAARPRARRVADRAHELAEAVEGPTLRRWAREFPWPAEETTAGPWTGRRLHETTLLPSGRDGTLDPVEAPSSPLAPAPTTVALAEEALDTPAAHAAGGTGLAPRSGTFAEPVADEARPASAAGWRRAGLVLAGLLAAGAVGATLASGRSPADPPSTAARASDAPTEPAPVPAASPVPVASSASSGDDGPVPVEAGAGEARATTDGAPAGRGPSVPPAATPRAPDVPVRAVAPALVRLKGVRAELRSGRTRSAGGEVAPGTWEVWADFGDGLERTPATVTVASGQEVVVSCSRLLRTCEVR